MSVKINSRLNFCILLYYFKAFKANVFFNQLSYKKENKLYLPDYGTFKFDYFFNT